MATITFLSTDIETKNIKFGLEEKMKDVCEKYAQEIKKNVKQLIFYSNGKKLNKTMTVSEFKNSNPKNQLYVVLMDENVDSEEEKEKEEREKEEKEKEEREKEEKEKEEKEKEEREKENSKKLKEEIIDSITNTNKEITYEETQELIVKYGFDCQKRIEKEKKEHPENFIEIEEAIKKKGKDEKLYVLGKLGKSLKEMGIEVAIDKTEGENNDDSLIVNQILSSGILEDCKYEIHFEDDIDIKKKYSIIYNKDNEQEKFIEEKKGFLSENTGISKDDIFIGNITEGCIKCDAKFKKKNKVNIREKMIELAKKYKNIKKIYEKNILGACKLTKDMLDEKGNRHPKDWPETPQSRGKMIYNPPKHNWVGYGLKVWDKYDNGNNDWIGMNDKENENEWAVAYHGTKKKAVKPICEANGKFFSTIKEGATRQKYKEDINIHKESKKLYHICGEGAYASPSLKYASLYGGVIIMCRVNPKKLRIPIGDSKNIYITDGTKNTIRPYRILIDLNKN